MSDEKKVVPTEFSISKFGLSSIFVLFLVSYCHRFLEVGNSFGGDYKRHTQINKLYIFFFNK